MTAAQLLALSRFDVVSGGLTYRQTTLAALQTANVPAADVLSGAQTFLCSMVDRAAEALRMSLLTPGIGQALEYQEANAEAIAALAAPTTATPALYPMLAASIGIDIDPSTKQASVDVLGVARAVQVTWAQFVAAGAGIRAARLKGKAAINAATTLVAAEAAFDAIAWPVLPAITSE